MFLKSKLMVSEAWRVGANTRWTCSNFWICQIQKRFILWWKRDFGPKSINISSVYWCFEKSVAVTAAALMRGPSRCTHRWFVCENVVKPLVLATFSAKSRFPHKMNLFGIWHIQKLEQVHPVSVPTIPATETINQTIKNMIYWKILKICMRP